MISPRKDFGNLSTASGLVAIVLWSTTFAFARSMSEKVGPVTSGAAVYLVGGVFCLARLAFSGRSPAEVLKVDRRYLFGCGGLFVFYTAAIYLAVGFAKNREQLLEVALINYLWPSLTVLFSLALLNKRASAWLFPGTILAITGVFLVMTQGAAISWSGWRDHLRQNPTAYALALCAAVAWGLYSNLARRWSEEGSRGAVELFVPVTGLILLVLRLAVDEPSYWNLRVVGEATGLGVVTTLGYILWDLAMRKGNLLLVAACSYFTPLLSSIVSSVYLGVAPGPKLWIGCLLLVGGSLMTWYSVSVART